MTALLLLAASAQAGLGSPLLLLVAIAAAFIPGLWRATQGARTPRHDPQAGSTETVIATIYLRAGSLRLRRRKGAA